MNKGLRIFVLAVLVGAVSWGSEGVARAGSRRVLDRVVALVGQDAVTEFELDEQLAPFLPAIYRISDPAERMKALDERRADVLQQLVDEILILEEAQRMDLPVTDADVEAHIRKTMEKSGWNEEELVENLKQLGYPSLAAYREKTRKEMLKAYAFQIRVGSHVDVSKEDVEREFKQRHPNGKQLEVRASHILIRFPSVITPAVMVELRDQADEVRRRIASGEISFEDAAVRYSQDTGTASGGGDLGYFTRYLLDDEFTKHAFALRPGEMSDVVQTSLGFHIIKVTDRREKEIDPFDLDEIHSLIHQELTSHARERAYKQWMRELRENAFVDIRLEPLAKEAAKP